MQGLTKRQREIVDFIETYVNEQCHSPSYRDIQIHFGFASLGSVYNHIQILKKKGFVDNDSRSLILKTDRAPSTALIPFIGKLREGGGIEMFAQSIMLPLPPQMIPDEGECYLLQIEGNALIEELMQEGDFLLVHPRAHFEEGEMVIALVEKHTTVIKRVYRDPPYLHFKSVNPHLQPLRLREDHVQIQGSVLSLLRNYSS